MLQSRLENQLGKIASDFVRSRRYRVTSALLQSAQIYAWLRHAIIVTTVALLHGLLIWYLTEYHHAIPRSPAIRDIQISLIARSSPEPPPPALSLPAIAPVPPPVDIEIDSVSPATDASAMLIAPRPDPQRRNEPPEFPGSAYNVPSNAVLRILVLDDGTIADAQIVRSSGLTDIDAIILAFVKAHWHYLPAELGGRPVQDWTTVIVPLKAKSG